MVCNGTIAALGSIEAVRPVFMIVMGLFLSLIAWRLAKSAPAWTARTLVSGALLLGFGYVVLLPLYEIRVIETFSPHAHFHGSAATALGWHVVKLVVMNVGWLLFGIGIALHAKVFAFPTPRPRAREKLLPRHESIA